MPPRKSHAKPKPELKTGQPNAEACLKCQCAPDIQWVKNPNWTDTLLEYLHDNVAFRIKLFSDSTADATKQARVKLTAKDGKVQQYATLAKHIFATEPGQSSLYLQNPSRFGTAVETRLRRCVFLAVHVYIATKRIQSQIRLYWLFKGARKHGSRPRPTSYHPGKPNFERHW
jgi:hypothetical protein